MKYRNASLIIKNVLQSLEEYEQIPSNADQFIIRLLDDLHYNTHRKITRANMEHFKRFYSHLFEEEEK